MVSVVVTVDDMVNDVSIIDGVGTIWYAEVTMVVKVRTLPQQMKSKPFR